MPVLPPKNPGCPIFDVGMPHARSGGDALSVPLRLLNCTFDTEGTIYKFKANPENIPESPFFFFVDL